MARNVPLDDLLPFVADWATCAVCDEVFKQPRVTPDCGHTFCSPCVLAVLGTAEPRCPLCREPFPLDATLETFRPNHQLAHVIESLEVRCKWGVMKDSTTGLWVVDSQVCLTWIPRGRHV